MPLRLDNARALPTCPQQKQQTKKTFKPRFKVDHAASPMPENRQPERLAPRATSNRNGGRDHLGILGEIISVHPGEIIGIRREKREKAAKCLKSLALPRGDEGQSGKTLKIKNKSALLLAVCYHFLLPPSSRQLPTKRRGSRAFASLLPR